MQVSDFKTHKTILEKKVFLGGHDVRRRIDPDGRKTCGVENVQGIQQHMGCILNI